MRYLCPLLQLFPHFKGPFVNSFNTIIVIVVMEDLYHPHSLVDQANQHDKVTANRTLKKLRIILILWIVSFVASIVWFSFSPSI